jgi:hypothetical protein
LINIPEKSRKSGKGGNGAAPPQFVFHSSGFAAAIFAGSPLAVMAPSLRLVAAPVEGLVNGSKVLIFPSTCFKNTQLHAAF